MNTKRILVVDGERLNREGVAEVLRDEGYEVATAADGHQAIATFVTFQPDLVITDLQLPGLDAADVLTHLKNLSPTTPVIIFTADVVIDARRKAKRLGAQDYLNKPLNFTDMLLRIARILK